MKKTKETSREQAMNWWNNLSPLRKTQLCDTNTELIGSIRRWETLTGSEVEYIYDKEHKHFIQPPVKATKQFKEFNPDLFKAYINKFSDEDKIKAFSIMCDLLDMGEISQTDLDDLEMMKINHPR